MLSMLSVIQKPLLIFLEEGKEETGWPLLPTLQEEEKEGGF